MDNAHLLTRPDRPRELVALIQRRSLAVLPIWAGLVVVGLLLISGRTRLGSLDLVLLVYASSFLLTLWLRRLHRRRYGDVRASEAQRVRAYLIGLVVFVAFVVTTLAGPAAIPAPLPFVFAFAMASTLVWEPWRISLHWLVPAFVLLWLSVMHVFGPGWLVEPGVYSLLTGMAGVVACVVDHVVLVRMLRRPAVGMSMDVRHV